MSTQKTPNFHVCYMDKSEAKRIKADKSESHIWYIDKSE